MSRKVLSFALLWIVVVGYRLAAADLSSSAKGYGGRAVAFRDGGQVGPSATAAQSSADDAALVKQYCLGCHNERAKMGGLVLRSEEHTSELQSQSNLVCRLLLEKKNK